MSKNDYRITITVISSNKEYPPISFSVLAPEELARLIMATPMGFVSLAVESKPGIIEDKTELLEFK